MADIHNCPHCDADLRKYEELGALPSFCLQCKFPLMLVAGKYRLEKIIGQGAVGRVYRARHIHLRGNADRVVKVIKQEVMDNPATIQRFQREVQITAELSQRNEHVVRIFDDFGEIPHLGYFYVMEYLPGVSLRQHIKRNPGPNDLDWCLDIFFQLCDAMKVAHEAGVIHRDLKPDNIMLIEKGDHPHYVKVLDWGIAKPMQGFNETDLNLTQGAIGTPLYMSPEQLLNRNISNRSDIYSMGVILYELITGMNPFHRLTGKKGTSTDSVLEIMKAQIHNDPLPLREVIPERSIPAAIDHALTRALKKSEKMRYENVEAFANALRQAAGIEIQQAESYGTRRFGAQTSGLATGLETLDPPDSLILSSEILSQVDKHPQQKPSPAIFGAIAALLVIVSLSVWGLTRSPAKQPHNPIQKRLTTNTPTSRRVGTPPTKRRTQPPTARRTEPTKRVLPPDVRAPKVADPPKLKPALRTKPTKRRVIKLPTKRIVKKPKRRRLCKQGEVLLRFRSYIPANAEIGAERGKPRRISGKYYCVNRNAGRVSVLREGYAMCIFALSKRKSSMRIKLKPEGGFVRENYCLK
ncbi:MAG TPA: hypothetical protein DCE42_27075 [Myxococcales bacterium]|nr:hypothetical protein [Deltaproteobacteria bacterium]HAA58456.1 hypothetical protein [Myxococcales bacterium]